ncbi:MAG TPA: hypothetical protein VGB74_11990 [Actinoplanes sp.]|jgi:hypothetical protein
MEDAAPDTFRPTWQQALGRGLYLGAIASALFVMVALLVTGTLLTWADGAAPPVWFWATLSFGPPAVGAVLGLAAGRRTGVQISARGIRTLSAWSSPGAGPVAPWHQVVDLRAERRGARTVVSVYLDSGASVQLLAPYSGEFFAADPRFEGKMIALSYLWRTNRFSGLPG